jgi:hypothetical protein
MNTNEFDLEAMKQAAAEELHQDLLRSWTEICEYFKTRRDTEGYNDG